MLPELFRNEAVSTYRIAVRRTTRTFSAVEYLPSVSCLHPIARHRAACGCYLVDSWHLFFAVVSKKLAGLWWAPVVSFRCPGSVVFVTGLAQVYLGASLE